MRDRLPSAPRYFASISLGVGVIMISGLVLVELPKAGIEAKAF